MRERTQDVPVDPAPFHGAGLRDIRLPGGARNALDAVLWELEALQAGSSVRRLVGATYRDGMIALPESFRGGR
jgi:L-alanine-DL-glutamate epimerase-like enolase superfamily enzyme